MTRYLLLGMLCSVLAVRTARAQDDGVPQALARGEGTYALLYTLEFRPGKSDEGLSILRTSLLPSWRKAGVDVTLMQSLVGTRNVMLVIPLVDGIDYFTWVVPDQDARTWADLARRLGATKAERTIDRFVGLLVRQSEDLVFLPAHRRTDDAR